jgi:hypothetical protein
MKTERSKAEMQILQKKLSTEFTLRETPELWGEIVVTCLDRVQPPDFNARIIN